MKTRILRKQNKFYVQRLFLGLIWLNAFIDVMGEGALFNNLEQAREARDRFYGSKVSPEIEIIEYTD